MIELSGDPEKLLLDMFTNRSPAQFDLGTSAGKPDASSIYRFDSALHRYSELAQLNKNIFFYNMNRLKFADIKFSGIGDTIFGMVKRTRKLFDARLAELQTPPENGSEYSQQEMFEKQMSSYLTNIEFDLISKSVSKSIENIYILLRQ